jgi:hypothetical protein
MLAKKIANVPIFKTVPRQSEYGADDQSVLNPTNQSRFGRSVISSLLNNFPEKFWREWLPRAAGLVDPFRVWRHHRRNSFGNKDFYTKAKE